MLKLANCGGALLSRTTAWDPYPEIAALGLFNYRGLRLLSKKILLLWVSFSHKQNIYVIYFRLDRNVTQVTVLFVVRSLWLGHALTGWLIGYSCVV